MVTAAVPPTMTLSQPITRKSRALKNAWEYRWKTPAPGPSSTGATASAESISAIWLTVE